MKFLDIGEVAERTGISPSALRYYEEIKLIRSVGRHGLRRQFDADVLLKLSLIDLGRLAGFSLAEIAQMFGQDGQLHLPRADLHAKADELERQIANLRVLRDALRHVADCSAPTHLECPSFRKLMKAASSRQIADRRSRKRAANSVRIPHD
ncbi:DNA-binding transcriptional MerR regulator [Sinorhizobium kostiense]|uniref:DNA-binding transcriptional MerR regulator n=1 Tax=Sinorhizobium kostiense TaxID=76747 RepID=A0ABS4QVT2_9HYPH|nr:helix-turn-helix domain-containing protein [Sinorhizobium kostiense]MBP2234755.1 DNA-binding transcriptional MerR regulator [Sinorhizobium kostiense]